ncbi:sulfite exporter TauE/SafE family protein [Patulibacter defluvii]|uniref:sulfite exporter TauE/SafE family protein n=1 Tax=Patulibacter defluvii TaxID=3095358 RepID=UPI002A74C7F8|nr:sulfite exporter TauE/SafE family protein [Patulibacter sp. DM4]
MSDILLSLALVAFGVLVGTLSGALGVGGGIFMVPFLVVVVGVSQQSAQATSMLVIIPTTLVATWSLRKKGVGDLGSGIRLGLVGAPAAALGALAAIHLPGQTLRIIFAVLMTIVAVRLIRDALKLPKHPTEAEAA